MKSTVLLTVMLALAIPLAAQGGPPADRAQDRVVEFLGLTTEQVDAWDGLLTAREDAATPLRDRMMAAEQEIVDLLEGGASDPAAVGALVVEVYGLRQQLRDVQGAYVDGFAALLDEEQLRKLEFIRRADHVQPLLPAFRFFGLLPHNGPPPDRPEL